jgi:hypothetical protein
MKLHLSFEEPAHEAPSSECTVKKRRPKTLSRAQRELRKTIRHRPPQIGEDKTTEEDEKLIVELIEDVTADAIELLMGQEQASLFTDLSQIFKQALKGRAPTPGRRIKAWVGDDD